MKKCCDCDFTGSTKIMKMSWKLWTFAILFANEILKTLLTKQVLEAKRLKKLQIKDPEILED